MSPTEKVTQYMNEYDVVPQVEEAVNRAVLKNSTNPLAEVGLALLAGKAAPEVPRPLSLPKQVAKAGGVAAWNAQPSIAQQVKMLDAACTATTVAEALAEARGIMSLGHNLWAYAYLRKLFAKNPNVYYATLAADPALLLPVSFLGALSTLRLHAHRCTAVAPCCTLERPVLRRWRTRRRWARRARSSARCPFTRVAATCRSKTAATSRPCCRSTRRYAAEYSIRPCCSGMSRFSKYAADVWQRRGRGAADACTVPHARA